MFEKDGQYYKLEMDYSKMPLETLKHRLEILSMSKLETHIANKELELRENGTRKVTTIYNCVAYLINVKCDLKIVEHQIKKVATKFKEGYCLDEIYIVELTPQEQKELLDDANKSGAYYKELTWDELMDSWIGGHSLGYDGIKLENGNYLYATCEWFLVEGNDELEAIISELNEDIQMEKDMDWGNKEVAKRIKEGGC